MNGRNKIYAALVICFAVVVSVWLLEKPIAISGAQAGTQGASTVSVDSNANGNANTSGATNADWQKILVAANPNAQTSSVVPSDTSGSFDDTTLTAQMAKDFFGQYLNVANQGAVTDDQANGIASNVMANQAYTNGNGVVYVASNLHINPNTDVATVTKYNQTLVADLQKRASGITGDPIQILSDAMNTNDASKLSQLNPIIIERQEIISDLLAIQVPSDAVTVHLALLNAYSNVLSNIQSMQTAFTDPVRTFVGANAYAQHITDLQTALANINTYFTKKLGTLQ